MIVVINGSVAVADLGPFHFQNCGYVSLRRINYDRRLSRFDRKNFIKVREWVKNYIKFKCFKELSKSLL